MTEKPTPTPEGKLIQSALKRSGLSARQAAHQAGISEGRWRQIANGYQVVSKGTYIPVVGPPETIAVMARIAGVTADQLEEAGRGEAAASLREITASEGGSPMTVSPAEWWDQELTGPSDLLHEDEVLRWRDEENVRVFQYELEGISETSGAPVGTPPEEIAPKLRTSLARTVARVSGLLPGRRQAATE